MFRIVLLFAFAVSIIGCYIDVDGDGWVWGDGVTLINYNFEVSDAVGNQMYPSVAYRMGYFEYFVVYQDYVGGDYDIYGVIVDSEDGTPLSSNFVICGEVDDQTKPFVVYNPSTDEYLVVWEDYRSGEDYDIYGVIVDAGSGAVGTEFAISSLVGLDEREPKAAYDTINNRYFVVWDEETTAGETNIYGRIIDEDGATVTDVNICDTDDNQQSPYVAFNPHRGEYIVVWMDFYRTGYESDVYGRLVEDDGDLIGWEFAVCDEAHNQDFPVVTYNLNEGEYLVVWEDDRNGDTGIWAQLLYDDATPIGNSYTIFDDIYNQRNPHLAYNSYTNEYMVVWEDNYYGNIDIFGMMLDRYGDTIGRATLLSDYDVSNLRPSLVANDDVGEYLSCWHARLATDYDILGQLIR